MNLLNLLLFETNLGAILGRRDGRWLPMFNPWQTSHFNGKGSPFGEQTAHQEIDKSYPLSRPPQCESRGTTCSGRAGVCRFGRFGHAGGQRLMPGLGYQVVERCGCSEKIGDEIVKPPGSRVGEKATADTV